MAMRQYLSYSIAILLIVVLISCTPKRRTSITVGRSVSGSIADVILFNPGEYGAPMDIWAYVGIANELGLSSEIVDHKFINDTDSFFDQEGNRRFDVLFLPGGEPYHWFEAQSGKGLDCQGVDNIL